MIIHFLGYIQQMLMINSEKLFFDIFSLFFAGFAQKMHLAMKIFPFFSFGSFLTLCQIKILRN